MQSLVATLAVVAGLVLVVVLCALWMRNRPISRRSRGAIIAGAMLLGWGGVYTGRQQDMVQESKDEANRKKDAQSGDSPNPEHAGGGFFHAPSDVE